MGACVRVTIGPRETEKERLQVIIRLSEQRSNQQKSPEKNKTAKNGYRKILPGLWIHAQRETACVRVTIGPFKIITTLQSEHRSNEILRNKKQPKFGDRNKLSGSLHIHRPLNGHRFSSSRLIITMNTTNTTYNQKTWYLSPLLASLEIPTGIAGLKGVRNDSPAPTRQMEAIRLSIGTVKGLRICLG